MKTVSLLCAMLLVAGSLTAQAAERSGEDVFKAACAMCHSSGLAGAPRLGEKADWAPRLAKGKKELYKSVKAGLNVMPPKGACANCSDKELDGAVDYMLAKAK